MPEWTCYVIGSRKNHRTYVGVTVDLARRLRQHRGIIKGGAKATRGDATWEYVAHVTGFGEDGSRAMSFEWHLKRASRKAKGSTPRDRRLSAAVEMLASDRWRSLTLVRLDLDEKDP